MHIAWYLLCLSCFTEPPLFLINNCFIVGWSIVHLTVMLDFIFSVVIFTSECVYKCLLDIPLVNCLHLQLEITSKMGWGAWNLGAPLLKGSRTAYVNLVSVCFFLLSDWIFQAFSPIQRELGCSTSQGTWFCSVMSLSK